METERIAKLETQVEGIKEDLKDVRDDIKELHSRVTTQTREIVDKLDSFQERMEEKMNNGAVAAKQQHLDIQTELQKDIAIVADKLKEVSERVDILERWRWMIVGGAVACGYLVSHFELASRIFGK